MQFGRQGRPARVGPRARSCLLACRAWSPLPPRWRPCAGLDPQGGSPVGSVGCDSAICLPFSWLQRVLAGAADRVDLSGGLVTPRESPDKSASPPGALVRWEDLYEREPGQSRGPADESERELYAQLAAVANAAPIRALRLRRQLRVMAAADTSPAPPGGC